MSGIDLKDVGIGTLAALAGVFLKGVFDWASSRGTSAAAVQTAINVSMESLIRQVDHQHDECRKELALARLEINEVQGNFRQAQQYIGSLVSILRRQGIDIPKSFLIETVFVLDSQKEEKASDA